MKQILKLLLISLFAGNLIFPFTGCVKEKYDIPPIGKIPVGDVLTIAQIRQIYDDSSTNGTYTFSEDYSVYANVSMDESSGNIYRSAYIQDNTGSINLHFIGSGGVRVGDSIRVYLKNCVLSLYSELLQIDNVDNDSSIIILDNGKYVTPKPVTIAELNTNDYESQLIILDNVQFMDAELGKTFADADASANRAIEDCDGNSIIVRTSNYANFAETTVPEGKGSLIAICGIYNDTKQLYIRTVSELNMEGERCDGGGSTVDPVDEIDEDFSGAIADADIFLEGWLNYIEAGDRRWQGKDYSGNKYAQASGYSSGLSEMITWLITPPINVNGEKTLTFTSAKAYYEHQSDDGLTVWASTNFDGQNVEQATWTQLSARIANENDPDHEWIESGDVDISGFSGVCYIAFKYRGSDTESTSFRLDDIVVSGEGGGGSSGITSIDEDFQSFSDDEDIFITGWLNVAAEGTRLWRAQEYSGNVYAQATSYNSNEDNTCWIITPGIDLDEMVNPKFRFETAMAYWEHDGLTVFISTDFDGNNIESATWQELPATIASSSDPDHEFIDSGILDLSSYSGMGYIGFRYIGSSLSGETTSYRIDNIQLYDE